MNLIDHIETGTIYTSNQKTINEYVFRVKTWVGEVFVKVQPATSQNFLSRMIFWMDHNGIEHRMIVHRDNVTTSVAHINKMGRAFASRVERGDLDSKLIGQKD